jgi:hypothetical protein
VAAAWILTDVKQLSLPAASRPITRQSTVPWSPCVKVSWISILTLFALYILGINSEYPMRLRAVDAWEVADHDHPLAEVDPARFVPCLEMPVDAFPAAAGNISELPLRHVQTGRRSREPTQVSALGEV